LTFAERLVQRRIRIVAFTALFVAGLLILLGLFGRGSTIPPHHNSELTVTFGVWDRAALADHLLLCFIHEVDFEGRRAYQHVSPVWLLFLYLLLKPLALLGVPYATAQHLVTFVTVGAMALLLYSRLDGLEQEPVRFERLDSVLPSLLRCSRWRAWSRSRASGSQG
jgi:hypothetical protein